jgi:predicted O-methyltransferase YrrM
LGDEAVAATEKLVRGTRRLRVQTTGAVEYMLHPDRGIAWGGPFNGQCFRQELFKRLVEKVTPAAIVETGTYLGTTTEMLAATGLPIFSVESNPRYYGFAKARFRRRRNVHLLRGDSRMALQMWFDGSLRWVRNRNLFVYLDAHWNNDLPLAEELEIVFGACRNAIVMIDDFRVPFDDGYGYDDYGAGRSLTAKIIEQTIRTHNLQIFYPATPSVLETGERRGCVVIAGNTVALPLASLPLLTARVDLPANV